MRRLLLIAVVLAPVVAAALPTGFAASLGVASQQLTSQSRTIVRATCATMNPSADASTQEDRANQTNDSLLLDVRSDSGSRRRYSYIRFDLGACGLPAGANVESAVLRLFLSVAPTSTRTYNVNRVTGGSWSPGSLTWSNQPGVTSSPSASTTIPITQGVVTFDVTSDTNQFATGGAPNHGWRISDGGSNTALGQFASASFTTAAQRPQLVVSYGY